MNPVKSKLKRGRSSIGSWIASAHVSVAEILAGAGFEWIAVDMDVIAVFKAKGARWYK